MSIVVQRQPADKAGPDIVSSVLTDDVSKIEAGRQDINFHGTDKMDKAANVFDNTFIRPGRMIGVTVSAVRTVGVVKGFSYNRTATSESISVNLEALK